MNTGKSARAATIRLALLGLLSSIDVLAQQTAPGEALDTASYGASYVESMEQALIRHRLAPEPHNDKERRPGEHGLWMVPSLGATTFPHSAPHNAVNKWGDTHLGIGFRQSVDVQGAYFAGQAAEGAWTPAVRVIGYRDGEPIAQTGWFDQIGAEPAWFAMDLAGVDRIVIVSQPVLNGGGWYGLDDLTYTNPADGVPQTVVVNFDDLPYNFKLTGSDYSGLTWETGAGNFAADEGVPGPQGPGRQRAAFGPPDLTQPSDSRATTPQLLRSFLGVKRGDAGSMSYPPDTIGAIGPSHYVETVNRNFAVYDRTTGAELLNILLGAFLPGSNGDPRVLYDQQSGRWIVIVTDFSATTRIYLAISLTSDALGDWFKTNFVTAQGADVGKYPDYPTLGVDANGIYTAAYMVGGSSSMTIFAINKAPLLGNPPSLGTVTAFRSLPWEGAIQPAHTYGVTAGEYCVSWASSSTLRIRRVNPPLTAPVLTEMGLANVPAFSAPPDAPALGSTTPLDTVDERLMMSVYRNGYLWTCHTISVAGRAGCRWYQLDPILHALVQSGTVADSTLHYYFPSLMVNQAGDVVMGFTGSSANQYAGCYYTGRKSTDPAGQMAPPVLYQAGLAAQNNIDGYGRNRWGDYSYTTLDPLDEVTFFTIQEYGHANNIWGTYVAVLAVRPPDCNLNGIPDDCDINCGQPGGPCDVPGCGQSADCNNNGIPDECEAQTDCNDNGVPDFCDLLNGTSQDCNANSIPDECDIAAETSLDCQPNGVPDECEVGSHEVVIAFPLDTNPGWTKEGLWNWGHPTGGGGEHGFHDPNNGHTGAYVYGYNLSGDYENNLPERNLTSPAIDCSGQRDVRLEFWRWLGVEGPIYDHAYVKVSNNGTSWVTVWSNPGDVTDSAWQLQSLNIAAVADDRATVYLRWTMGTTDTGWRFCGWNIDDIEIHGTVLGGGPGDCNSNAIPDACDIANGTEQDCNANAVPDACDIANGTSQDVNGNGIPDECEFRPGDLNCDEIIDFDDINGLSLALSGEADYYAIYPDCHWLNGDCNFDGTVDFGDINPFVNLLSGL